MAETLSAPPVLSTPDEHILTEVSSVAVGDLASSLSEEQFKIRYEIDRTLNEIREHKWRRIALQFPDHMLPHSARVYQMLARGLLHLETQSKETGDATVGGTEESIQNLELSEGQTPVKLTILADTSYGSCCVDEIAAEHVDAEAVVHYGRACLSPTARLPVIYVYTHNEIDIDSAAKAFLAAYPDKSSKVILTADIPFISNVHPLSERLSKHGYTDIHVADIVHNPSSPVPNRTLPTSVTHNPATLSDWHLYHICDPPTALLLTLASRLSSIHIYNPASTSASLASTTTALLRRRYALLTSLSTVSTWGILINTLSVSNYLDVVTHLQRLISASGRKSYLFVVGKLNPTKISNFSEIGGWVVVGCWESSLIDSRDFYKPILTPFELELALQKDSERVWTGEWSSDFQKVLLDEEVRQQSKPSEEEGNEVNDGELDVDSEEESAPPEFDLRTGRYVSHSRPVRRTRLNNGTQQTSVDGHQNGDSGSSSALTRRAKGEIATINGVASPGAEHLATKRTWKGLGSDFEIKYDDEEVEGAVTEQGRSGLARGYTVGDDETESRT